MGFVHQVFSSAIYVRNSFNYKIMHEMADWFSEINTRSKFKVLRFSKGTGTWETHVVVELASIVSILDKKYYSHILLQHLSVIEEFGSRSPSN